SSLATAWQQPRNEASRAQPFVVQWSIIPSSMGGMGGTITSGPGTGAGRAVAAGDGPGGVELAGGGGGRVTVATVTALVDAVEEVASGLHAARRKRRSVIDGRMSDVYARGRRSIPARSDPTSA